MKKPNVKFYAPASAFRIPYHIYWCMCFLFIGFGFDVIFWGYPDHPVRVSDHTKKQLKPKTDSKHPMWDFGFRVQHGAFYISDHTKQSQVETENRCKNNNVGFRLPKPIWRVLHFRSHEKTELKPKADSNNPMLDFGFQSQRGEFCISHGALVHGPRFIWSSSERVPPTPFE